MKGAQEGLSSQVSGTVWPTEWLSFVRIWRVWVGGKRGASVFIHTLTSQTRPFCRHTPPLSSHNRARQQVNTLSAHLTSRAPASHQIPNRSIIGCGVGGDVKKKGVELQRNFDKYKGDNKTPQGAGGRLEWEMENKGKPQGFRKIKLLRWLHINPLRSFQTPYQSPSASSECTATAENTRSDSSEKGCRLLMLAFSAWHFIAPRKPGDSNYPRWNCNYAVCWSALYERCQFWSDITD